MAARIGAFSLLCLLCLGGAAGYLAVRATQLHALDEPRAPAANQDRVQDILARPHVVFLDTPDYGHRHLALAPLDDLSQRAVTETTRARPAL